MPATSATSSPGPSATSAGPRPGGGAIPGSCGKGFKTQVKPFTRESLERMENKTVQLVKEYGFQPRRKVSLEDGSVLPGKFEPFPSRLYGRPLEEIDNFIYEETFCVVSKRFRKNYIHRFTATKSFFLFSPWNAIRRTCIFLSTNQYFDYVVMTTILLNCVFLAMTDTVEEAEYIFLAIYTAEMIIKSIAKGFILNKYTYLRNPWNWLDFVVITSGYVTIGMEVGNLAGLRTFRVLRALKTVSIMPGLKTIINALLHSIKQLAEVMTLTIFCLMVFALFALQVYMGELRNKCVRRPDSGVSDFEWFAWVNDSNNWMNVTENEGPVLCGNVTGARWVNDSNNCMNVTENEGPVLCGNVTGARWMNDSNNCMRVTENVASVLCGNVTGARHCPSDYFCLQIGGNPNHGYTSFDNFLWSMLTTFQLITLDYWENVYNMVLSSCGPISVVFFTVVVFFGSFYLINLMLAVVALSYEEEAEITQEERRKDLTDHRDDSTFSFDPSKITVKQLEKNKRKRVDSRKGVLLASYTRKKTRRRKRGRSGGCGLGDNNTGGQGQGQQGHSRSATPSPRHSDSAPCPDQRPQSLTLTPPPTTKDPATPQLPAACSAHAPGTLHPADALAPARRGQLLTSRHTSSNNSNGNNRESSLDDSGVVDDHEEGDVTSEDVAQIPNVVQRMEPVTVALTSKEIRVIKCNGVSPAEGKQEHMYTLPSDYLSHIVVLDDLPDRNCDKCTQCCVDYDGWLRFQSGLYKVVRDPLFDLLITVCIILNTMFLAMEHHGMSGSVRQALDISNKVFTSIFTLECFLKILALSKEYFACGWNIFDLIIVSASLLDLSFELMDSLVVLRCLRLLRVLKLARSWTTMRVLLSIIISTIGALGNLTFVLVIVIYIFAVIGMQLFSKDYTEENFSPDAVPRWNFSDFFHSFMMVFRILCGEWIEPLWDCMRAEKNAGPETCFAIFLPALVMGNFMVLNLFLALLLNSFNSEELKSKKEPDDDDAEAAEYVARLQQHMRSLARLWRKCWCPYSRMSVAPTAPVPLFHHCRFAPLLTHQPSFILRHPTDALSHSQITEDTNRSLFLHSLHEEVGEESKLARSFERLRSIVRKKRQGREKADNEQNMRLEELVCKVMTRHAAEKYYPTTQVHETVIGRAIENMEHSQQVDRMDHIAASQNVEEIAKNESESGRYCPTFPRVVNSIMTGELEDRKYSVSCHEALNKHAEDKRYSLALPKSVVSGMQESENDKLCSVSGQDTAKKDALSEQEDNKLRLSADRELFLSTQQTGSKDESNADDSIEVEVLDKVIGESDTMLPSTEKQNDSTKISKQPWKAVVSYVDELTVGGRRDSQGHYVDGMGTFPGFGHNKSVKVPEDCFPQHCYQRCTCCDQYVTNSCGQRWTEIRTRVLSVVDTQVFEWFILVLIFASSIMLCFEDIYLDENVVLKKILYWTNLGFCALFSIEMILKWLALGFWRYFTNFWTILDFIIVLVSIFSLLIEENENLKVLRSLRTLRALRPLRAISRWQGMRIVVNALMYAIPSIFNVLLVCLVFWLIFSIMGVQFFGGKFFKCMDKQGKLVPLSVVKNKDDCNHNNFSWVNSKITFDNVGNAYLALFQVATFEGWMEVMADAVDARGVDLQPEREANLYAYLYFVVFIVCGSFFTLNLFIGVIIDNFNMLKKKYEGGMLEMFLTESQKHYYTAMKKLGRKKPQKVIKRPINQMLAMFYDLSNSRRFEIAIFVLIVLNMLTMGIEHYNQPHPVYFVLQVSNAFFTTVFGLEAIVKIVGLRYHYFTVPWNLFDFLLVVASILGILMEDIMIDFPISPTLLRVIRVFRIGRILRLIKAAKGIRKLLFALVVSLPALFNIGALLALVTFIYAIIGMSVFGHVKQQGALDDMVNFETFGRSMQLLFRLMTSAGWNDVLESLMVQQPDCDPTYKNQPNGDCGSPLLAITYLTSFIIISFMIVINMYIAIILENFNQAHQEEEIGIVEDDLEMFYVRWSKYDPHATQFIRFTQLSDFIASLDPPLGIPKPNIVALVSFNLPIARGNKIHCLDILHSLVKYVLGHVEETEDFRKLQEQMDIKFKKQFPTRRELEIVSSTRIWKRQDKAARTIQAAYREYIRLKREREREPLDLEDEMTQTSSPGGGWQSRLSAFLHVHRGSRASSRKSSRASDASELSELGGAWLNLPLLFLSGAHQSQADDHEQSVQTNGNGDVCITVSEPSPDTGPAFTEEAKLGSTLDLPLNMNDEFQKPLNSGDVSILVTQTSPDAITIPADEQNPSTTTGIDVHPSQTSARTQDSDEKRTITSLESTLLSATTTAALDRHPLGLLRPVGTVLSLFPMQVGNGNDIGAAPRKPASEAITGPVDMHPIRVRPGTGLSLPPSDPSTNRLLAKSSPERRRSRFRQKRLSDAKLVHVLVHRESEESTDDKGS